MLNRQVVISPIELAGLEHAASAQCEPPPNVFRTRAELDVARAAGKIAPQRHLDLSKLFDEQEGIRNESNRANSGQDMGDLLMAQLDVEHAAVSREPAPKIETREQAIEAIKKFELNKSDLGDQVIALDLRQRFGIWEALP